MSPPSAKIASRATHADTITHDNQEFLEWSHQHDYDIWDNQQRTYTKQNLINDALGDIQAHFYQICSYNYIGKSTNYKPIAALTISDRSNTIKPSVALVGGLNGDEAVGSEMLIRLARHITTGKKRL